MVTSAQEARELVNKFSYAQDPKLEDMTTTIKTLAAEGKTSLRVTSISPLLLKDLCDLGYYVAYHQRAEEWEIRW